MPLLLIWLGVNAIALLLLFYYMNKSEGWWDVLLYPKLHEYFESEEVGGLATIFMDIIITLILAPALMVYFSILVVMMLISVVIVILIELKKRTKK